MKKGLEILKTTIIERLPSLTDVQLMSVARSLADLGQMDLSIVELFRNEVRDRGKGLDSQLSPFPHLQEDTQDIVRPVHEGNSYMVLNKPSGIAVSLAGDLDLNPSKHSKESNTSSKHRGSMELHQILERECPFPISKDRSKAHGILHRLDRDTTGALLVAKTYTSFYDLRFQFAANQIRKEYTCLVNGHFPRLGDWVSIRGRIHADKTRDTDGNVKLHSHVVDEGGEHAFTEYMPLATYAVRGKKDPISFVKIRLHTGRSHQIRVHLSSIGHPLLFDWNYADQQNPAAKFFLHAHTVEFWDPDSLPDRLRINVNMPTKMQDFINNELELIESIE